MGLVFTIPLETMLVFPGIGTFSRLVGIFVAIFAFLAILANRHIRKFESIQIFTVMFLLWSMFTFFWSVDYLVSYRSILTLSQLVIFSFIVWQLAQSEEEQNNLMKAYVFGALISCGGVFYSYLSHEEYTFFRYSAYGFDPNDIGLTMALAIPMAWYLSLCKKERIMDLVYRSIVIFLFLGTTLTASRGAFVALMVSVLFVFWAFPFKGLKNKIVMVLFLVGATIIMLNYVPSYSWERITGISSEITTGSFSGRLNIWREGLRAFLQNPVFGVGVGSFKTGVEATLGRQAAPHNLFLGILVGQGIVGLLIFVSLLVSMFNRVLKMTSLIRKYWIILLATWCAGVMSLSWELEKPTWFLIGLVAAQTALGRTEAGMPEAENPLEGSS